MRSSAVRELLKITQDPEIISFAGGLPAPEVFPIREVEEACTYVVRKMGKEALQYSATEGYRPLKEFLSDSMHKYGIPAKTGKRSAYQWVPTGTGPDWAHLFGSGKICSHRPPHLSGCYPGLAGLRGAFPHYAGG